MINPVDFLEAFRNCGLTAVTGVPDSLLKEFCETLELTKGVDNVRAANEEVLLALQSGTIWQQRNLH